MHNIESITHYPMASCPTLSYSYDEIERWLVDAFARLSALDAMDVDIERAFVDYQLDSSVAVTLAQQLGQWGNVPLQATIFWEYPNIRQLALILAVDGKEVAGHDAS